MLHVCVKPVKEAALPEDAILRFEHPMVLVGETEELGRNATQLGGIEGRHSLRGDDTIVLFALDAEDWSVPLIYKTMGRVLESLLVSVPESTTHVPVGKPHFFRFQVLLLDVEDAIVGDESLETLVVAASSMAEK